MIAVILVNWNGRHDTLECLESLMRLEDDDFVAVVVDNGSTDGSLEAIETWATAAPPHHDGEPWARLPSARPHRPHVERRRPDESARPFPPASVVLVPTGANLGFAGASNVGMALARRSEAIEGFWILNNDTVVAPDCLAQLRETARRRPDAGLIGTRLHYYHDADRIQGVAGFFLPMRARGGHIGRGLAPADLPSLAEIEARMAYVMGASLYLSTATYDRIGPMSEDYFLYYEEADWAARLGRGVTQTVALDAIVYHKEGGSIGTSSTARPSDTSLYYLNRNLFRYMWTWKRPFILFALLRVVREAVGWARRGDWRAVRALALALADALRGRSRRGPLAGTVSRAARTTETD